MKERANRHLWKEAASWYARMQEPQSEQEVAAFEAWLARDTAHARTYGEMVALSHAAAAARPSIAEPPSRSPWLGLRPVLAAAAILAIFATTVVVWQGFSAPAFARVSNPGEAVRGVRLVDGTEIWLDAGAEVGVRLDAAHREIVVHKGRVRIGAAPGVPPLAVVAGRLRVAPASTRLDVAIDGQAVVLGALDGTVSISSESGQAFSLPAGKGLAFDRDGAHSTSLDRSWPGARLRFADTRLARIVAIANRQSGPDIVFANSDIGKLTVTGVLDLRDTRRLARKLAAVHDLRLVDEGFRLVLSR